MNPEQSRRKSPRATRTTEAVVKEHLSDIYQVATSATGASAPFANLMKALIRISAPAHQIEQRAEDAPLRKLIGLALTAPELEKSSYDLEDLDVFIRRHGNFIDAMLSNSVVAEHLAPTLLAPLLFHRFQGGQYAERLQPVARNLCQKISKEALNEWQMLATRSVIWGYRDPLFSASPHAYQEALGFTDPLISIADTTTAEMSADKHKLLETAQHLTTEGYFLPPSLWKACSDEVREDLSWGIPIESAVQFFDRTLKDSRERLRAAQKALSSNAGAQPQNDESPTFDMQIETELQELYGSMSVFCEYLSYKEQNLMLDPVFSRLAPKTTQQRTDYLADPIEYYEARFREYLQRVLGRLYADTLQIVCAALLHKECGAGLPLDFTQAACQVAERSGIFLDEYLSTHRSGKSFADRILLPLFDKFIEKGDVQSALNLRLFFPEDVCECSDICRYPVDDYIASNQSMIADGFLEASKELARRIPRELESFDMTKREALEEALNSYSAGISVLIRPTQETEIEGKFVLGVAHVFDALFHADTFIKRRVGKPSQGDEILPPSYAGAREVGRLLSTLQKHELAQAHSLGLVFRRSRLDVASYASDFIASTNKQLDDALSLVKVEGTSLHDVQSEFEASVAAEMIYDASPGHVKDSLPVPIMKYLEACTLSGYGVLRAQHGMGGNDVSALSQPWYAKRLKLWSDGLIGDPESPARREFLSQFFDAIRREELQVHSGLRSLVFDALLEYSKSFLAKDLPEASEQECRSGISVLLGGFLLTPSDTVREARLEMARVFRRVFDHPRSQTFLPDSIAHEDIAEEFQGLVFNTLLHGDQSALIEFINSPAISLLLKHLELLDSNGDASPYWC